MEVQIKNKDFLATLDSFKDEMFAMEGYHSPDYYAFSSPEDMKKGEYYTSEEYLREVSLKGDLVGPPDRHFAQPISLMVRRDPQIWSSYMNMVKFEFASEIGAHTSALLS